MASSSTDSPILLLIDLQQGLIEGPPEWGPRSTPDLVENVTTLLQTWRSKEWPVLHVHHDGGPDNSISSGFPKNFAPHASAAPLPSEPVFIKKVGSPFVATKLPDVIKELGGKRKIVVIGMDGGQCINNTTRHGTDLGYEIVVVGDSCSSYAMNDWRTGKDFGADETHIAAMSLLTGDVKVTTTKDVLSVLGY